MPRKKKSVTIQNNGNLSQAIFGLNPMSPFSFPFGYGAQLSQWDTMFRNNRWYLLSNNRQLLSEMYIEHGLIQTMVRVPVDDAFRGGVEIISKQLSTEELQKLKTRVERENDMQTLAKGCYWTRLFGGGGIIIMSGGDPESEFKIEEIKEGFPFKFRAADMWELLWGSQDVQSYEPQLADMDFTYYDYYGLQLHKSRVMKLKGLEAPSFVRPRLRGWGFSILESVVRSINQYLKANDLTFEVLDEFKVDAYKIQGFNESLISQDGVEKISRRIQIANQQKNFQHAIVMDSEDDFIQKTLSFTGMAEIMREIRIQVACDLRMPLPKIFGVSAAGFNSGEDDIENYNAMVESEVREKIRFDALRMIEMRCQQLFGYVPDDLEIDFKPLRILSADQEETVKSQKFSRLLSATQAGLVTPKQFAEGANKDNLLPVQLDPEDMADELEVPGEAEAESPAGGSGAAPKKSTLNPKEAKS